MEDIAWWLGPWEQSVVGVGLACIDNLAFVPEYPTKDTKTRTTKVEICAGGNCANSLVALKRLSKEISVSLVSKVGLDPWGASVQEQLLAAGVSLELCVLGGDDASGNKLSTNTSGLDVTFVAPTSYSYIIVEESSGARTIINTPGPVLTESEAQYACENITWAKVGAVVADGRHPDATLVVAQRAIAHRIPVVLDCERIRAGTLSLLQVTTDLICAAEFPALWASENGADGIDRLQAMGKLLSTFSNIKLVICTRGERGAVCLLRRECTLSTDEHPNYTKVTNERMIDDAAGQTAILETNVPGIPSNTSYIAFTVETPRIKAVDTTGAGDNFVGGYVMGLLGLSRNRGRLINLPLDDWIRTVKMACRVGAASCTKPGAHAAPSLEELLGCACETNGEV